jgi:hypothetical protein
MLHRTNRHSLPGHQQEPAMYQNINEQFASTARQFAETAAQVNRLALASAEKAFGLQLSTLEENTNAAFAFWGELAEVRDIDGLKAVWPKGVQVARESVERSVSAGQEVLGQAVATNEAIAQIAKGQVESAVAKTEDAVQAAAKASAGKARK